MIEPIRVYTACKDVFFEAIGIGNVPIVFPYHGKDTQIILTNVLHAPCAVTNLISTGALDADGYYNLQGDNQMKIIWQGEVIGIAKNKHQSYIFDAKYPYITTSQQVMIAQNRRNLSHATNLAMWHRRFGHINESTLKKLIDSDLVSGMDVTKLHITGKCCDCIVGKMKANPFTRRTSRVDRVLARLHCDLAGPVKIQSLGGSRYAFILVDEYSRYSFVSFVNSKSDVPDSLNFLICHAESETGMKLLELHSDNGTEIVNNEVDTILDLSAATHWTTVPYTRQQDGISEREIQTCFNAVRTMLNDSNMPKFLWGEAMAYFVHCQNWSLHAGQEKTPYKLYHKKVPDVSHLQSWGCPVYYRIPSEKQTKLGTNANEGFFVGVDGNHIYRIYDAKKRDIIRSRDVVFMEGDAHRTDILTRVGTKGSNEGDVEGVMTDDGDGEDVMLDDVEDVMLDDVMLDDAGVVVDGAHNEDGDESADNDDDNIDDEVNDGPRRSKRNRVPSRKLMKKASAATTKVPQSYRQAMASDDRIHWQNAMLYEFDKIAEHQVATEVERPSNRKIIQGRWVYAIKDLPDNAVEYRARYVGKGYSEIHGIDFTDTFAPVAQLTSLRLTLAIAVLKKLPLIAVDINSAFLNANLTEEIYIDIPEGFRKKTNTVWLLHKALYGLKQSARAWYAELKEKLHTLGFICTYLDHSVFHRSAGDTWAILTIHTDDITGVASSEDEVDRVKKDLGKHWKFKEKDFSKPVKILGILVTKHSDGGVSIAQPDFIESALSTFNMIDCNTRMIPGDPNVKLIKNHVPFPDTTAAKSTRQKYQSLIGTLQYAASATRPDIANRTRELAAFNQNPSQVHITAAFDVLRYLKQTKNYGLWYHPGEFKISAYCNADYASNLDSRKSVSAYIFCVAGAGISWSSRTQRRVAQSTTEAEYAAINHAAREAVWIRTLVSELYLLPISAIDIQTDNKGALDLALNPVYHSRTKHIDIESHWV